MRRGVAAAVAAAALLAACGEEPGEQGSGSGARPVSECPTELDGTFEVVGRFPVKAVGVDLAISGDRVAFADAHGSTSYDVRLVGLAGASAPTLDAVLLEDVAPLPVSGEPEYEYAPLQLAAARDGILTAHGDGKDVVVTRFDRAGHQVWQQTVPADVVEGEVSDLRLVDGSVHLRFSDTEDYPGSYGVQVLSYHTGKAGERHSAPDPTEVDAKLDVEPAQVDYRAFGYTAGPPVSLPNEDDHLSLNENIEPPEASGAMQCGDVLYWIEGVDLWPVPDADTFDPESLGKPVRVDTVPEVVRHAGKGDGAVMGVTPDAVWVGWKDFENGEGTMFALAY